MAGYENKTVLVMGLGVSGVAASQFLAGRGAKVVAVDSADNESLQKQAQQLRASGIEVQLAARSAPAQGFDLAIASPGIPPENPIYKAMTDRGIPVMGELELGFQNSLCLNIAITGTNGKTTTTELVERLLSDNGIRTMAAGNIGLPLIDSTEITPLPKDSAGNDRVFQACHCGPAEYYTGSSGPVCRHGGIRARQGPHLSKPAGF